MSRENVLGTLAIAFFVLTVAVFVSATGYIFWSVLVRLGHSPAVVPAYANGVHIALAVWVASFVVLGLLFSRQERDRSSKT